MRIERTAVLRCAAPQAFALVDDLAKYPRWMDLVHSVHEAPGAAGDRAAWDVELRAQVGPFARSKRLRMARTLHEPPERVIFERAEIDGRRHSPWVLECVLTAVSSDVAEAVEVGMTLSYGGNLWTGAVLERVLDDHVERGALALADLAASDRAENPES